MTTQIFVGIDVAKNKHDVAIADHNFTFLRKKFTFSNNLDAYHSFTDLLDSLASKDLISIGMEVTGNYGLNLYKRLRHDGYHAIMIPPESVTHFRKYKGLPKSDKIDAKLITEILYRKEAKSCWIPKNGYDELKQYIHRRNQVNKMLTQEKTRLISLIDVVFPDIQHVLSFNTMLAVLTSYPTPNSIIDADVMKLQDIIYQSSKHRLGKDKTVELVNAAKNSIAFDVDHTYYHNCLLSMIDSIHHLKVQVKNLDTMIDTIARRFPVYHKLLSLPGCGITTAAVIIAELGDISRFSSGSQIVSFSGIYSNNKLSGDSVHSDGKMAKRGSRTLRHALYMIAEFARRKNPVLQDYFTRKKQGKRNRHCLAVNAVANKLCHVIYSIMKNNQDYIIYHKDIERLPELTRKEFFQSIEINSSKSSRRKTYLYEDRNGEIHLFQYLK